MFCLQSSYGGIVRLGLLGEFSSVLSSTGRLSFVNDAITLCNMLPTERVDRRLVRLSL
jgi:hypothetical protein